MNDLNRHYARIAAWKRNAYQAMIARPGCSDAMAWACADSLWHRALDLADGSVDLALTYPATAS